MVFEIKQIKRSKLTYSVEPNKENSIAMQFEPQKNVK